ncbi:MAG: hypothetical protein WBP81_03710 [Solirubrobacteraceae bacterium]
MHTDTGDPQHLDAMAGLRAQAIDAIGRAHMGLLQTRLARPNESRYLDTRLLLDSVMNAGGNVTGLFRCLEGPRLPPDRYPASAQGVMNA